MLRYCSAPTIGGLYDMTTMLFAGRSRRLLIVAGAGFVLAVGIAYAAVPGGK